MAGYRQSGSMNTTGANWDGTGSGWTKEAGYRSLWVVTTCSARHTAYAATITTAAAGLAKGNNLIG